MTEKPKPNSFSWPFWLLLVSSVSGFFILGRPRVVGGYGGKDAKTTEAVNNLRQIGLALHEFEKQFGSFPDDQTANSVRQKFPSEISLDGSSSNALFRQIIAAEIFSPERIFSAKIQGSITPDGNIRPGEALKRGEVAFAYISGLSSDVDPMTLVAFAPIIPGTTTFDPKPFKGKAVFLRADNSVFTARLRQDGRAYDKGINLLSAKHPVWKGKAPVIHYPDL